MPPEVDDIPGAMFAGHDMYGAPRIAPCAAALRRVPGANATRGTCLTGSARRGACALGNVH
jgi:hypothetical protein